MTPIGINWKAVWKQVWKKVWKQAPIPAPTPTPTILRAGGGASGRYEEELWEQIQYERWQIAQQNADDLEVVRVLTEFLSRM